MPSTLMIFVDRKLSKKRCRDWVWLIALSWFREKRALDLRSA